MDSNVKIKICGLTTKKDIEVVNALEIDYVGFIFAPSKRQVTPEEARMLIGLLNPRIKTVGVFVDEEIDKVNQITDFALIDIAQLHGHETPKECGESTKPVWKSLLISSIKDVDKHVCYPDVSGILLDTFIQGVAGGSGKSFDWKMAKDMLRDKIILAGGLSPLNVLAAIKAIGPQVVDVSSGVETNGIKDLKKMKHFIGSVKGYE